MNDNTIIDDIQKVRTKNNKCWMDILRLAVKHSPKEAKEIMKRISENDAKINKLSGMLANN